MLKTKTYKFSLRKASNKLNKKYKILFGNYGVKSINSGLVTSKHIENLRRKLSKQFKKLTSVNKSKIFIRLCIWKAFTNKPLLSRMGKGAGIISNWKAFIKPGFILFEILTSEIGFVVSKIFTRAQKCFPLRLVLLRKLN
jgi:large subunit ribosomal protein L16